MQQIRIKTARALLGTCIVVLAIAMTACHAPAPKPSSSAPVSSDTTPVVGATRYQVDSAASSVRILVYRGGSMARLGHNHVVSSNDVTGVIWLHPDLPRSKVSLTMPVNTLRVDDSAMRAMEGADFAAEVPQEAREGTRRNLLRAEVLDGDRYPNVTLQSIAIGGSRLSPSLTLRITIKDAQRNVIVPVQMSEANSTLTAKGEFEIKQSEFGITPFSVALGALQVVDTLKIKFSIVARQQ